MSLLRPRSDAATPGRRRARAAALSERGAAGLRIGEVARRAGTTPRTIRYYEELGLLPATAERDAGATGSTARQTSSGSRRSCA